jgi:hypothetical protein
MAIARNVDRASNRAALESLLRDRKLDRTLTSAVLPEVSVAAFEQEALDRCLRGGLPRGQVSEVTGPVSSGRTAVAWAALASATRRGEIASLVDTFDRFDPETAAAAGIDLSRLLWVRGQAISKTAGAVDPAWLPGVRAVTGPGTMVERTIDRALKALNLVVQSGVCTLVAIDLLDVPPASLARIPASTWLRFHRIVEGTEMAMLIVAAAPITRSPGGISIQTSVFPTSAFAKATADRPDSAPKLGADARPSGGGPTPETSVFPTPDFRLPTPDSRLPTPDSRLPTPDSRLPTPDSRLPIPVTIVWRGDHDRSRRLGGISASIRATSPRGTVQGSCSLLFTHVSQP